jgi:outer membrane protein assembly factor BamB
MYGANLHRTFSSSCASPITKATVATLVPAWYVDTARPVTATPVVADGVLYVGSWEAVMYAIDARTGSVRWRHFSPPAPGATYGPIVSSAALADVPFDDGVHRLVVFGSGPRVYALDASDGHEVWLHDASAGLPDNATEYESSPLVSGDVVLIGRDTHDEDGTRTGGVRGGLVALDVRTGAVRWTFEPEQDQGARGCGGIWGSPALDPASNRVFVGTANCPHDEVPWTPFTNAVVALDATSGLPVWRFRPNEPPDDDTDFGATPNVFVDGQGRPTVGAGKKDGTYYALDAATGQERWRAHVQDPAHGIGGFIGSPAVVDGTVVGGTAIGAPPYFHGIDATTGAVRFSSGLLPSYAASGGVNGIVFNAALDTLLKAYDAATGQLLWTGPLGAPGSSGPAIYDDMVFIGSGTSTSDACEKDNPTDELCVFALDTALGVLGGINAFRLLVPGNGSGSGAADPAPPATSTTVAAQTGTLPKTGGATPWWPYAVLTVAAVARTRHRRRVA